MSFLFGAIDSNVEAYIVELYVVSGTIRFLQFRFWCCCRCRLCQTLYRCREMTMTHHFQQCRISVSNPSGNDYPYLVNLSLFDMLLMNLLTNAVKYNHSSQPEIEISFEVRGKKLYIYFKDNGIGIEKAEKRKIFRKFYQVGSSDDMSARGSGLGLYLVENIAKIHKAKITVESRGLGKGSTFALILPLRTPV